MEKLPLTAWQGNSRGKRLVFCWRNHCPSGQPLAIPWQPRSFDANFTKYTCGDIYLYLRRFFVKVGGRYRSSYFTYWKCWIKLSNSNLDYHNTFKLLYIRKKLKKMSPSFRYSRFGTTSIGFSVVKILEIGGDFFKI